MKHFFEVKKNQNKYLLSQKGQYLFFLSNLSGNLEIEIKNKDCQVFIFGAFIGKGKDKFCLKTVQHHQVGKNLSNLFIKGVFFDQSQFFYEGLIRIEKGADQSSAFQKNQNLILSPKCTVESKPYLEILANDVFCTHGSTTSRLEKDQLYYLASRGLTESKAGLLLVKGFLGEVFKKMSYFLDEKKVKLLYQRVEEKIPSKF